MTKYLIDTDVLIDLFKRNSLATEYIRKIADYEIYISSITIAELLAGAKNEEEISLIQELDRYFTITPISGDIAVNGGLLRKKFLKSHGIDLADALIAATAIAFNAQLLTLNVKHYPMFQDLSRPYIKT